MIRKLLSSLLIIATFALLLTSCDFFLDNRPDNTDKSEFSRIVADDSVDVTDVRNAIHNLGKGTLPIASPDTEAEKREIVFGDTDRAVSTTAKSKLDSALSGSAEAEFGYIIYCDGDSIAVYWLDGELEAAAIVDFIDICVKEKKLEIEKGTVTMKLFKEKEMKVEAIWSEIKARSSDEFYNALRGFASGFNGTVTCEWMANLWDGELGGFYYSNSARDYEPFRPDLESTFQVISWLKANGASDDVNKLFPNEMKAKLVDFAKNMQYPDGYFYHPQWAKGTDNLQTDRYGRDLSWASDIISHFTVDTDGDGVEEKQYPKYCTPSGLKCKEHSENGGVCTIATPAVLKNKNGNVKAAVAKLSASAVKPVSSVHEKPDYSSPEAFVAWLERMNVDIKTKPGTPSHYINALQHEIRAKGYVDELLDYLEGVQEEVYREQIANRETPSGLWSYEASFSLAQSIQKYFTFINDDQYGRPLKYYKEALATCIEIILLDANGEKGLNDLMNQCNTIDYIIANVKKYHADNPELIEELYGMVRARGVEIIECIERNLDPHRLGDGMFVYYNGKALSKIYGVHVSKGVRESDVNGMILATTLYRSIFKAFNYPVVPLCTEEDGDNFISIISNVLPVEKIPPESEINFEDTTLSAIVDITFDKVTTDGAVEIVEDQTLENGTSVLKFSSGKGDGKGDTLRIAAKDNAGNCNIVEFDLLFAESSGNGEAFQLKIGAGIMLGIWKNGDYLEVQSVSDSGANPDKHQLISKQNKILANKWHRIRVEIYDVTNGEATPKLKFFVDNKCVNDTSLVYYGSNVAGQQYQPEFTCVTLYSKASYATLAYLDNVYLSREIKYFESGDDISDMRDKS